jgi:hypothetical protein
MFLLNFSISVFFLFVVSFLQGEILVGLSPWRHSHSNVEKEDEREFGRDVGRSSCVLGTRYRLEPDGSQQSPSEAKNELEEWKVSWLAIWRFS